MNCDEFLEAMTSADERQRTAARRHVGSCPTCAVLADVDALLRKELSSSEPLSRRLRATWAAAADEVPQTTLPNRMSKPRSFDWHLVPLYLVTIAAGLLFLIVIPILVWQRNDNLKVVEEPHIIEQPAPRVAIQAIDASAELADLLTQVNALEAELKVTAKHAELLDARREAGVLLATHSQW
jgi:hypothetical protein